MWIYHFSLNIQYLYSTNLILDGTDRWISSPIMEVSHNSRLLYDHDGG